MKALSIKQPWAWLIATGQKDIENRNWAPTFKGRIYIHAGQSFDFDGFNWLCVHSRGRLDKVDLNECASLAIYWRISAIIGEVDIVDHVTQSQSPWFTGPHGFVLANPLLYKKPIPCKGRPGFFEPHITP